jgi:hypothetical protein
MESIMNPNKKEYLLVINKNLNSEKGVRMLEKILEAKQIELPETKTIKDFGGGYVECLKTKAKVVLYFGFDDNRNRVSINFDIKKEDVIRWQEAIAEKIWNTEKYNPNIVSFDDDEPTIDKNTRAVVSNNHSISKPKI